MPINQLNAQTAIELIQLAYLRFEENIDLQDDLVISTPDFVKKHKFICELFARPDGPLSPKESFGIVTQSATAIWIAIRGTDSAPDWLTDARLEWVNTEVPHGQITAGVDDLALQLLQQISRLHLPKPIILCGHSLGAAVVTALANGLRQVTEIYPIASPLFANDAYANFYNTEYGDITFRIVNTADEVPKIPKDIPGVLDLHHVCPALEFTDDSGTIAMRHSLNTYKYNLWRLV